MKLAPFLLSVWLLFGQNNPQIELRTTGGNYVTVKKGVIYFNQKAISGDLLVDDDIVYSSNYNRLIEQDSSILLFLEIDNRPNFNVLEGFRITSSTAIKLVTSVYNDKYQGVGPAPFTDMDNDGNLEIGGFDLTEAYDAKDSMDYQPSRYYEIKKGKIIFDSTLTKHMDTKINGLYLKKPLDENGNCCVVIKKPVKK